MASNQDLERWQIAILGIEKAQSELSPEELSAFVVLKELYNNGIFKSSGSGGNILVIKDNLSKHDKNRLLSAHLKNFIDVCDRTFTNKGVAQVSIQPSVIQPQITPLNSEPVTETIATEIVITPPELSKTGVNTPQNKSNKKDGNLKLILIIAAISLLIGGWYAYQNLDSVKEMLGIETEPSIVRVDRKSWERADAAFMEINELREKNDSLKQVLLGIETDPSIVRVDRKSWETAEEIFLEYNELQEENDSLKQVLLEINQTKGRRGKSKVEIDSTYIEQTNNYR